MSKWIIPVIATVMLVATACAAVPQAEKETVPEVVAEQTPEILEETVEEVPGEAEEGKKAVTGGFKTYYELLDGTWECDGYDYKYRLEISGQMSNAAKDSTFIYLSNTEEISFQRAAMAAGLSSNMDDYFSPEEAVLIDWIVE